MVPASLTRPAPASARGSEGKAPALKPGLGPANVLFTVKAEWHALMVWGGMLGVLGVLMLLGYVWVRLKVVETGYRLSAVRQLVERLELEGRELAVRAAAADASERLEALATKRLGMRRPQRREEAVLP